MFARVKIIIWNFVRLVQKILVTVFLFLIYVFGFGMTVIFLLFFNQRILGKISKDQDTFWGEVQGYEINMEDSFKQS